MEYTQWVAQFLAEIEEEDVLILVVMEYTQWVKHLNALKRYVKS